MYVMATTVNVLYSSYFWELDETILSMDPKNLQLF